jgi:hypothetical protein
VPMRLFLFVCFLVCGTGELTDVFYWGNASLLPQEMLFWDEVLSLLQVSIRRCQVPLCPPTAT